VARGLFGDAGLDDGRVGGQEADVGGALEQVAREHVDGDLRLVAQRLAGQLQPLLGQAHEQLAGELAEARADLAHVGLQVGQVRQQGQRVPGAAQRGKRLAVVVDGMHVARERRHVVGEGDAFVRRHGVGLRCGRRATRRGWRRWATTMLASGLLLAIARWQALSRVISPLARRESLAWCVGAPAWRAAQHEGL